MTLMQSDPDARVCARPGCDNPLKHGSTYCSNSCAAKDRTRKKSLESLDQKLLPAARELIARERRFELFELVGAPGIPVLNEIAISLEEDRPIPAPPMRKYLTSDGYDDTRYGVLVSGNRSYRRTEQVSYDVIDDMRKNGMVQFALAMKQAPIRSVLRNRNTWMAKGSSERMRKMVDGMMRHIFRLYSAEMLESIMYGAAFFEKVWDRMGASEWGIEDRINGQFYGYKDLRSIHPKSISYIRYKNKGQKFNGFVQGSTAVISGRAEITVPVNQALVITHGKRFRSLWGTPAAEPMYPYWFWLEVAWRSFLRYLERTGTPVTVVYAPARGKVYGPDDTEYTTMKYALMQAAYISKSSSAAFPSDVDPDTGKELWRVDYLQPSGQSGGEFLKAIQQLGTALSRSVVVGDRTGTQGEGFVGGNLAAQHWNLTQLDNEQRLDDLLHQASEFVVGPLVKYNGKLQDRVWLEAESMDNEHKERLGSLLNTMGNQQDSDALRTIDWEGVLNANRIPVLDEADIDAKFEKELDRSRQKQEVAAKAQQDAAEARLSGKNPKAVKVGDAAKEQGLKRGTEKDIKNTIEWPLWQLSNGATMPVFLTREQAEDFADRTAERPTVFDMHVEAEYSEVDAQIDQIVKEVMSEVDTSELTSQEIADLRRYILGIMGIGPIEQENDDLVISLGLKDFLSKTFQKIKSAVNRVVKKVTGKDLGEWKKAVFGTGKSTEKYKVGSTTIISVTGVPWNPEDHPRDESGRFAKKGSVASPLPPPPEPPEPPEPPPEPERDPGKGSSGQGASAGKAKSSPPTARELTEEELIKAVVTRTQDEVDAALLEHNVSMESYGADPETALILGNVLLDTIEKNEYLGRTVPNVALVGGTSGDFEKDYPEIAEMYRKNPAYKLLIGGFYEQKGKRGKDDFIVINNAGDTYGEQVHFLVHEIYHATSGTGERVHMNKRATFIEEATTDLLSQRWVEEQYGFRPYGAYGDQKDRLVQFLHRKNGGDKDAMWRDVKALHSGVKQKQQAGEWIKNSGLDLTPKQMKTINWSLGCGKDTTSSYNPFTLAFGFFRDSGGDTSSWDAIEHSYLTGW